MTELARKRRRRRARPLQGLVDPKGRGLADDLIGHDRAPADGWRQFDSEGYRLDEDGKRIDDPDDDDAPSDD